MGKSCQLVVHDIAVNMAVKKAKAEAESVDTRLRNGDHLNFDVKVGSFVDNDSCFAFFGDVKVRCAIAGALAVVACHCG